MHTHVRIRRRNLATLLAEWPQAVVVEDTTPIDPEWVGGGFARQLPSGPGVVRVRIEGVSGRAFNRRWIEILDQLFNAYCAMRERQELDSMR
jgi:hypothetical protein